MTVLAALLSTKEVALWGAVGGAVALTVTQVLPAAISVIKSGTGPKLTPWRLVGVIVVVAIFVGIGAVAALIFRKDETRIADAIAFGMAWEALIGGVMKTGKILSE